MDTKRLKKIAGLMARWALTMFGVVFFNLKRRKLFSSKFKVAICACFKNEEKYLREWIEYHLMIGVEHFYLFNNESSDGYIQILEPYITNGHVTVEDIPGKGVQYEAYKKCLDKHHQDVEWIAMIDLDEFITVKKKIEAGDSLPKLTNLLARFEKYPSVRFWWRQFGSSGLVSRPLDDLVVESFVACEPLTVSNNWGKCFLNMRYKPSITPAGIHNF